MKSIRTNPPWVAKLLKEVWPTLQKRVTDPNLLPKDGPKTKEYGCGHYGCVLPANLPGIVCKITTDTTEAKFVQAALTLFQEEEYLDYRWPPGMIRYFAVYQIPGKQFRKRPIYVIWRAEAATTVYVPTKRIHLVLELAHKLRDKIVDKKTKEVKPDIVDRMYRIIPHAHRPFTALELLNDGIGLRFFSNIQKGATGAASLFVMLEEMLSGLQNIEATHYVGEAMEYYLHEGILLADVHTNNIRGGVPEGFGSEVNLISDPGHAVFLDPRWVDIKIPTL